MLKEGSIVKVRLYDTHGKEIIYSKYDEDFEKSAALLRQS